MAAKVCCHLCAVEVERGIFMDVFGIEGRKQNLPGRICTLQLVPVEWNDGLSPYVCRICKLKLNTLETKLENFRAQAAAAQ